MDQDEATRMLNVVLGRLDEQSAMLQGMRLELGEVREDLAGVKNDVAGLKSDVAGLKDDVAELKNDVATLNNEVAVLRTEFQVFSQETWRRFDGVDGKLDWLAAKVMEHDQAIFQLRRKQA